MFTPVLLFSFSGLMVSLAIICKNPMLVGSIATEGTAWYGVWSIIEDGAWTVFNQMELLFVIGLPIGLAKKPMLVQSWKPLSST
jgi:PTS system arbutin-like IIC component